MTDKPIYNEPAFPVIVADEQFSGMTLRDYFAAKAMEAIYADPTLHPDVTLPEIAIEAYKMADALLTARGP